MELQSAATLCLHKRCKWWLVGKFPRLSLSKEAIRNLPRDNRVLQGSWALFRSGVGREGSCHIRMSQLSSHTYRMCEGWILSMQPRLRKKRERFLKDNNRSRTGEAITLVISSWALEIRCSHKSKCWILKLPQITKRLSSLMQAARAEWSKSHKLARKVRLSPMQVRSLQVLTNRRSSNSTTQHLHSTRRATAPLWCRTRNTWNSQPRLPCNCQSWCALTAAV